MTAMLKRNVNQHSNPLHVMLVHTMHLPVLTRLT